MKKKIRSQLMVGFCLWFSSTRDRTCYWLISHSVVWYAAFLMVNSAHFDRCNTKLASTVDRVLFFLRLFKYIKACPYTKLIADIKATHAGHDQPQDRTLNYGMPQVYCIRSLMPRGLNNQLTCAFIQIPRWKLQSAWSAPPIKTDLWRRTECSKMLA